MYMKILAVCIVLLSAGCETVNENRYYLMGDGDSGVPPASSEPSIDAEVATVAQIPPPVSMQCHFDKDGFGIHCFGTVSGGKGESETGPGWYGESVYGHGISGYSKHYNGVFGRGGAAGVRGDSVGDEPSLYATGSKQARIRLQHLGWSSWDIDSARDDYGAYLSFSLEGVLKAFMSENGELCMGYGRTDCLDAGLFKLKLNGGAFLNGDLQAPNNAWGGTSGEIDCPELGECACPAGYYVTKIVNRGSRIVCNQL